MAFSAFFSGTEIAFISSNRVRASVDSQKKTFTARIVNLFYHHQEMFISTLLVGNNIMLVFYGMGMAVLLEDPIKMFVSGNEALVLLVQALLSTGIILITGEFLPKSVSRINPNRTLRHSAVPMYLIYIVLYPISWFSSVVSKMLMRFFGAKSSAPRSPLLTVSELDDYIQQTLDDKKATNETDSEIEHEVRIFQNALDFSSTLLRDCMVPRNEIVAVDIDTTDRETLRQRFIETGLSKIVVYKEDINNILGYIHVSELFDSADWKTRLKQVEYAPESMLANAMMRKLLAEKKSMAIIVDEFGETGGLITLEDLVEEIFGDFEDEHDKRKLVEEQLDDNTYRFAGRIEIEHLNEAYDFKIPEGEDYQTLAGYILFSLGEIPETGETAEIGGLRFTILKKSANKLELIKVERIINS